MKNTRNYGIDLLRILAMVMIVAFHYKIHMNYDTAMNNPLSIKQLVLIIFGNYGVLGSNAFFVICSYFLLDKNNINMRKIVDMVLKVSIVSSLLYILVCLFGNQSFNLYNLFLSLCGIFTYQYWFISIWVIIMLIFPFLNYIVYNTKKSYYIFLLVTLFIFLFVYPSFKGYDLAGRLGEAIWIYLFFGFLEKRSNNNIFKKYALFSLSIMIIIDIVYQLIVKNFGLGSSIYLFECGASTVYAIGSVSLFYLFKNINIKSKKIQKITAGGGVFYRSLFMLLSSCSTKNVYV